MNEIERIDNLIRQTEKRLLDLESEKLQLYGEIEHLKKQREALVNPHPPLPPSKEKVTTTRSSREEKIALFRRLFKGREDVYARRWESKKTGKSGYQPACEHEWVAGICGKPSIKCSDCPSRSFIPLTDATIRKHLEGEFSPGGSPREHTIGIYPLLADETCCFLAVDFDKKTWMKDAAAFLETCKTLKIPAALERSRSGNGGHI